MWKLLIPTKQGSHEYSKVNNTKVHSKIEDGFHLYIKPIKTLRKSAITF